MVLDYVQWRTQGDWACEACSLLPLGKENCSIYAFIYNYAHYLYTLYMFIYLLCIVCKTSVPPFLRKVSLP